MLEIYSFSFHQIRRRPRAVGQSSSAAFARLFYWDARRWADTPRATLSVKQMGDGQLADQFAPLANALNSDGYDRVINFKSVYHPGNGDFEAGFRASIETFKSHLA